jgi:hypothetical protein
MKVVINVLGVVLKFTVVMIILCPHPGSSIMFLEASAAISGEANMRSGFAVDPL